MTVLADLKEQKHLSAHICATASTSDYLVKTREQLIAKLERSLKNKSGNYYSIEQVRQELAQANLF